MTIDVTSELKIMKDISFDNDDDRTDFLVSTAVDLSLEAIRHISGEVVETLLGEKLVELRIAAKIVESHTTHVMTRILEERINRRLEGNG